MSCYCFPPFCHGINSAMFGCFEDVVVLDTGSSTYDLVA